MRSYIIPATFALLSFSMTAPAQQDITPIYRWCDSAHRCYRIVSEGECTDEQLAQQGWTGKTAIFNAYREAGPGRIAVYGWYNATTGAYISVAEDEFTDDQMQRGGYAGKHLQFYGLISGDERTVRVYRGLLSGSHNWVTIPDGTPGDETLTGNCNHRTYQYVAMAIK